MTENVWISFDSKLNEFLESRKNKDTELDARKLIAVFAQAQETGDGWIRSNDLKKILKERGFQSERTFSRFLKDLFDFGLIFREERIEPTLRSKPGKKKPNVYYKLRRPNHNNSFLKMGPAINADRSSRTLGELAVAKLLLRELGILDPDTAINNRLEEVFGIVAKKAEYE